VVIEADLADRACAVLLHRAPYCLSRMRPLPSELSRLMRMNAGGESNPGPGLPHGCGTPRLDGVARREDAQGAGYAGIAGPGDHGVQIGRELVSRQMAVRIDHEWSAHSCPRRHVGVETDERRLASVGTGSEHHTV